MNVFDSNSFPIPTSITVETLTPNSQYRLGVNTVMGSYRSEISWIDVMTTDIQFFETAPAFNDDIWIDSDSFSLSWQPLENADSYSILLESLIYSNSIESVCGFEDIEQPWETSSRKFNKALFGSSSPSLQLDNDGDWMSFSTDEGKINGISFWVRSQSSSNSFRIETLDPLTEEWKVFIEETPGSGAKIFSYDIPESSAVRIVFSKVSGYLLIDDFKCLWQPAGWMGVAPYDGMIISNECSFTPTGLKEATQYRVSVTGISDSDVSKTSICHIQTTSSSGVMSVNTAERQPVAFFDLLGNRVDGDVKGVLIQVFDDGSVVKKLNR